MTYPPTGPGYPSAGPAAGPSGPSGVPGPGVPPVPPVPAAPGLAGKSLPHLLCIPVLALGVLNFLLGFAPFAKVTTFSDEALSQSSFEGGYPVIALALLLVGGLLAGLSLLPGQAHQATAAVTSLTGFLVALFFLFTLSEGVSLAWGGILTLVLGFVQAAIAITVLLFSLGVVRVPAPRPAGYGPQPYGAPGYGPPAYPAAGYGQAPTPAPAPAPGYPAGYGQPAQPGYGQAPNPYGPPNPYAPPPQYPQPQPTTQPQQAQPPAQPSAPTPPTEPGVSPVAPTQAFDVDNHGRADD
ncbi:hypothetical protein GCM10023094_49390 [Rhodococcus olei]|uniref:Uncharacterized protein n=1 Tax=Rhodococcus olei TaxID=2161675 RepID=A0ABP8PKG8_9NOCA